MNAIVKKCFSIMVVICIIVTAILSNTIIAAASTLTEADSNIVFAKWDGTNGKVAWTNPGASQATYNSDGSVTISFTGNSGQPQCIAGLSFNNSIAQEAIKIALAGSKKITFSVTYTGGQYNSGTESLYNQLNAFLGNSTSTVSYTSSSYMKVHNIVLDVSSLTENTSFLNYVLQIQAQNYSGSGFKNAIIVVSPIKVVPEETITLGFTQSAADFVSGIKVGWNLGNTLENKNVNYINQLTPNQIEVLSGNNPVTTQAIIDKVKSAGFNAIRLPISWFMFVTQDSSGNYLIDSAWIARIKEIIQYAYNDNMYIIMDMHHDDDYWLDISKTGDEWEAVKAEYQALWEIIATEFRDYDAKLVFEGANELIYSDGTTEDWYGTEEMFDKVNELYQIFVDTVRATGGNNAVRYLMLPTYGAQMLPYQMENLVIPNDDNHIIVDIHWYETAYTASSIQWFFTESYKYFLKYDIPVVLGECGLAVWQTTQAKTLWGEGFVGLATEYGIKCFLWDDGGNFKILARSSLSWNSPQYLHAVMANTEQNQSFTVPDIPDQSYTGNAITPHISIENLTEGTDYRVAYANNVSAGKAAAFIIGINNYLGFSTTKYFNIIPVTTLADFEDGTVASVVKGHYVNMQVVDGEGADCTKALKITYKTLTYVPGEDTIDITLTPAQIADSIGMRIWIKGSNNDYIRKQLKYYTNHIDSAKTENYRTNGEVSISADGGYISVYWGDQATYNWYHDGTSSWEYSIPTIEQMQASLFKIGISFAGAANTGAQELYIDKIELLK